MNFLTLLFHRDPCSERLLNEELEAAGFHSATRYRRNFDPDRRCRATVGAVVLSPQQVSPIFRAPVGGVSVSVSADWGVLMEDLEKVHEIVQAHKSVPDPDEETGDRGLGL